MSTDPILPEMEDCGCVEYSVMRDRQLQLFGSMVQDRKDGLEVREGRVFLVEHPHVYTLGLHGHADNLLVSEALLAARGIPVVRIERGGDITYHGPGQLVVYPVIDLLRYGLGVKSYIHLLEEAVIRTIAEYGIRGERVDGATGVWIDPDSRRARKICAIGVKCSRFVTMHGLALNVETDLSMFGAINPCGFTDKGVTSILQEIENKGETPSADLMAEVKEKFSRHLQFLLKDAFEHKRHNN